MYIIVKNLTITIRTKYIKLVYDGKSMSISVFIVYTPKYYTNVRQKNIHDDEFEHVEEMVKKTSQCIQCRRSPEVDKSNTHPEFERHKKDKKQ